MHHPISSRHVVRVGVIGGGQLAREVHLPILAKLPGVQIGALADPSPDALALCRPLAPHARLYNSPGELVNESSLDAILVASPTAEHAEHARMVLASGKALYLEKPLASTLEEGLRLVDFAATNGTPAMMGFNYRFHPLAEHLRSAAMKSGGPHKVRSVFSIAARPLPGWKQMRSTGGGVLLDLASHHFDLLRFLLGAEVKKVTARISSERTEHDCCEVDLSFDNGSEAHGSYSFCRTEQDTVEITGADGRTSAMNRYAPLDYPLWPPMKFLEYQIGRRRSPWKEVSFQLSLTAWLDSIRNGSKPPVTLADGLESLRIVAAAEEPAG